VSRFLIQLSPDGGKHFYRFHQPPVAPGSSSNHHGQRQILFGGPARLAT
jgi:hypothetical protein